MSVHYRPHSPSRPSAVGSSVRSVTPSPPDSPHMGITFYRADSSECIEHKTDSLIMPHTCRHGDTKMTGKMKAKPAPVRSSRKHESNNDIALPPTRKPSVESGSGAEFVFRRPSANSRVRMGLPEKLPHLRLPLYEKVASEKRQALDGEKATSQEKGESEASPEEKADCPDTPTPIPPSQKQSAFQPLQPSPSSIRRHRTREGPEWPDAKSATRNGQPQKSNPVSSPPQYSALHVDAHPIRPGRKTLVHSSSFVTRAESLYATYNRDPHHRASLTFSTRNRSGTTSTPRRNVSISARSNISAGTAHSNRSIFSTPGRDELELKKAMVELDEGPFGRVTTMADLQEERKAISSMQKPAALTPRSTLCGLKPNRCSVM